LYEASAPADIAEKVGPEAEAGWKTTAGAGTGEAETVVTVVE
jgi:hypothetical protein